MSFVPHNPFLEVRVPPQCLQRLHIATQYHDIFRRYSTVMDIDATALPMVPHSSHLDIHFPPFLLPSSRSNKIAAYLILQLSDPAGEGGKGVGVNAGGEAVEEERRCTRRSSCTLFESCSRKDDSCMVTWEDQNWRMKANAHAHTYLSVFICTSYLSVLFSKMVDVDD